MEEAYKLMRDETTVRVDLRVRSETMLELHTGLVQLWLYCLARETGCPASTTSLTVDLHRVTEGTLAELKTMFRKAGIAFFLGEECEARCALSSFRTSLAQHTISFSILPIPKTLCSGRIACT
jgi:hypothetical protein